jgi:hypothetical protein
MSHFPTRCEGLFDAFRRGLVIESTAEAATEHRVRASHNIPPDPLGTGKSGF